MYLIQMLFILTSKTLTLLPNDCTYNLTEHRSHWIGILVECKADKIKSVNGESVFQYSDMKETDKTDL